MILKEFLFLDKTSGQVSNPCSIPREASDLVLQVQHLNDQSYTLQIVGILDKESIPVPIAAINMSDLSVVTKITTDGIYSVSVAGMKMIVITNESEIEEYVSASLEDELQNDIDQVNQESGVLGNVKVYGSVVA